MYIADLAPYYDDQWDGKPILAVGWLEHPYPFPTGSVPPAFLNLLKLYTQDRARLTVGTHWCPFCNQYEDRGSVFVESDTVIYVIPRMIWHYVVAHMYRPPEVFIQALLATPIIDGIPHLQIRRPTYHPWFRLTARETVEQYKHPTITQDPRWREASADKKMRNIEEEINFEDPDAIAMIQLFHDRQYDREPRTFSRWIGPGPHESILPKFFSDHDD